MRRIWNWLNGKKTTIAAIYWTVMLPLVKIIYENGVPDDVEKILGAIGLVLAYVGLGHKIVKNVGVKL